MGNWISLPDVQPDIPATTPPTVNFQPPTPPNWSQQKALYAITFQTPSTSNNVGSLSFDRSSGGVSESLLAALAADPNLSDFTVKLDKPGVAAGYNKATQMNMFVFDAIKRAQHRQTANLTQHPLQTGFNISDHVIKQPVTIQLEIGMSDAIASYTLAGFTPMWELNPSKSVSAYQQMVSLMDNRQIMDINTRLQTYFNMVLVEIASEDTHRTYFGGLSMVLTFQQAIIADVAVTYESARIQSTDETTQGTVQPQPPTQATGDQHNIFTWLKNQTIVTAPGGIPTINIPGAGNWTSNIISGTKDWFKSIGSF